MLNRNWLRSHSHSSVPSPRKWASPQYTPTNGDWHRSPSSTLFTWRARFLLFSSTYHLYRGNPRISLYTSRNITKTKSVLLKILCKLTNLEINMLFFLNIGIDFWTLLAIEHATRIREIEPETLQCSHWYLYRKICFHSATGTSLFNLRSCRALDGIRDFWKHKKQEW